MDKSWTPDQLLELSRAFQGAAVLAAGAELDVFGTLARRSHRTIWLNPEAPFLWATGDSDMLKYAPLCDVILQVSTLAELTAAIDKLLVQK